MFRLTVSGVAVVAAVLALVLWSTNSSDVTPVEAHGTIDQSQTQGSTEEFNGTQPMQQSFKPAVSSIVGVDIKASSAFSDDPSLYFTIQIRKSFRFGPIIGIASHVGLTYNPAVVHVDFPSPIPVTPGDTYWLEVSGDGNHLQWVTQLTGNPYANGAADSEVTAVYPDADRYFVTYNGPAITATPVATPTPATTPAPTPRATRTPR